ncbi:MAG: 7,8-didemethyl-8-hydroxy-5-deazariboflavin synthase subunit CofH [Halobacteriota archaeon]
MPLELDFEHRPVDSKSSFETAIERARDGDRLSVDDAVELLTTGSDADGVDARRRDEVLDAADVRRRETVGDEVTFVANYNNNLTTACDVGCEFCNFKDSAWRFREGAGGHGGYTLTPEDSGRRARAAVERGVYEICSVSGLHPALALDAEHREALDPARPDYVAPAEFDVDPGCYVDHVEAMSDSGAHVHAVTPEEAAHACRGVDWGYREVYRRLNDAGLDSVPGTAAEVLVDEVRDVICPNKIDTGDWLDAMRAAADVGLDLTATIMYGHVENEMHRAIHLERVRLLQDEIGAITEFVPLSFVHPETPLYRNHGVTGASRDEDLLMVAVSRLYLDNVDHVQSSWVKYGDDLGLRMLECGADDFMGTLLSEEITKRAGGEHGEFRSFEWYVDAIESIDRVPVERSTDYRLRRRVEGPPFGPALGPEADGSPLVDGG